MLKVPYQLDVCYFESSISTWCVLCWKFHINLMLLSWKFHIKRFHITCVNKLCLVKVECFLRIHTPFTLHLEMEKPNFLENSRVGSLLYTFLRWKSRKSGPFYLKMHFRAFTSLSYLIRTLSALIPVFYPSYRRILVLVVFIHLFEVRNTKNGSI